VRVRVSLKGRDRFIEQRIRLEPGFLVAPKRQFGRSKRRSQGSQ